MHHKSLHELFQPTRISVKERYVYESELRIQNNNLTKATGEILATILYDKQKEQKFLDLDRRRTTHLKFEESCFGFLKVKEYGRSNLLSQLEYIWDRNCLPIEIDLEDYQKAKTEKVQSNRLDFMLSHEYCPSKPTIPLIEINVELLDEDYFKNPKDTIEKTFLDELGKRMNLKRNLILRFEIILSLPKRFGQEHENNPPILSNMSLSWPISTPYYLADLYAGQSLYRAKTFTYDPEQSRIEWKNIPFHFKEVQRQTDLYIFKAEFVRLEIREPSEIYEIDELLGSTTVQINQLLSGMVLEYENENFSEKPPTYLKSTIVNNFTLKLSDALKHKSFLPSQYLHFSGIIFSDMRIADIAMLLEDKGFQLSKQKKLDDKEQYIIKAERLDGSRKLEVEIQVQATASKTIREREILGKEKYTTSLPIGHADILITGKMKGDPQYVIREVNDLQQRLKEHFGYVSAVG